MSPRAQVIVQSHPLWRLRLRRGLPRYLLSAVSLFGILASARLTLFPPRPVQIAPVSAPGATLDRAAEAYAVLFARRYLTWSGAESSAGEGLEPFVGTSMEANAGLVLPAGVVQRVDWAEVVQAREPVTGTHIYTVAAQTDAQGLLYLTVGVTREASGALALSGYPAFVGPPDHVPAAPPPHGRAVDPALEVVVRRALGNYMSASSSELAADLTPEAQVSLPPNPLTVNTIGRPGWTEGSAVQVLAQASDSRGVRYTLAYELDVAKVRGRWEISAIQTDPRD